MLCTEAKQCLSAFCDDELPPEQRDAVARHLATCSDCARELQEFRGLSAMTKELPRLEPPCQLWEQIEARQDSSENRPESRESARQSGRNRRYLPWGIAVVAAALVAIGWIGFQQRRARPDHHQFVMAFNRFLREFQQNAEAAQQHLVAIYSGRPVNPQTSERLLGYTPVVAMGLPNGYSVKSAHIMTMPCCTCVECLCERDDGSVLAIFEHDEKEQNWFGVRSSRDTVCHGKPCKVIDVENYLAAVWHQGPRCLTVIGARSQEEIDQLVGWFDGWRMHHAEER